jgi:hypothetical protein
MAGAKACLGMGMDSWSKGLFRGFSGSRASCSGASANKIHLPLFGGVQNLSLARGTDGCLDQ